MKLDNYTKKELFTICKQNNLTCYKKLNKNNLIEFIYNNISTYNKEESEESEEELEDSEDSEDSEDDEDKYECLNCSNKFHWDNLNFTCEICCESFCYDCDIKVYEEFINNCPHHNCYHCRNGSCFYIEHVRYCEECVPKEYFERIEEEENELKLIDERKKELKDLLNKNGLQLRDDSKLCSKYIYTGNGDLEYIIERMSEMKYLFEYCHMRKVIEIVKEEMEEEYDEDDFDFNMYDGLFESSEERALEMYSNDKYPDIFPWMLKKYNKAAKVIQKYLYNWLWKPVTKDGKLGINARISLRKSDMGDFLYASEIN
jgi:hypothetical protein